MLASVWLGDGRKIVQVLQEPFVIGDGEHDGGSFAVLVG